MNESEIFHVATMARYGGLMRDNDFRMRTFREICFERLSMFKRLKSFRPFPNILHDFTGNYDFNACADVYQNYHIIGLNGAVFYISHYLFNQMMAQKSYMTHIGDPSNDYDVPTLQNFKPDIHILSQQSVQSKDFERIKYAQFLTTLSCVFVFMHELSHVMYGHVDYIYDTYNKPIWEQDAARNYHVDFQTIESHADASALYKTAKFVIAGYKRPQLTDPKSYYLFANPIQSLQAVIAAVYNVFRLFGDRDYNRTIVGHELHPAYRLRQAMLFATVPHLIEDLNRDYGLNIDVDHFHEDTFVNVIQKGEEIYSKLTGKEINREVFRTEYFFENPLMKTYGDHWQNLRSKMQKFTFWP